GGGYDDWDAALDGLLERGYDSVRIDAFPHLIAAGAEREWTLKKWGDQPWGAPGRVTVRVMPALIDFVSRAHRRGIKVALSTWFREDDTNARMRLADPEQMASAWIATLDTLGRAGLLDSILYVDLCNEWPANLWAPFVTPPQAWGAWPTPVAQTWINRALDLVRTAYPDLPLCFSTERNDVSAYLTNDVKRLDLIEQHIWMIDQDDRAFSKAMTANAEGTTATEWADRVAAVGETTYRGRKDHWDARLVAKIDELAAVSRRLGMPVATTEGWSIVSITDWPMLDWGWIKESCAVGIAAAAASGRWLAICTSNFCGPQSASMWRDIAWHRRQTDLIRRAPIDPDLRSGRFYKRFS
ncbi:MAG: cellulase, partial [Sphingopyxis sp.]|nr:cellulase [Sphingopyxis sp.]